MPSCQIALSAAPVFSSLNASSQLYLLFHTGKEHFSDSILALLKYNMHVILTMNVMRDYTMWTSRTCSNKMTPGREDAVLRTCYFIWTSQWDVPT